jgi:hypothetical protein
MGAPAPVDPARLREIHIKPDLPKAKAAPGAKVEG